MSVSGAVGSRYATSFTLPGTESQRASALLRDRWPAEAGESEQIVFHARSGSLRAPALQAGVVAMLERLRRMPGVAGVASPYAPGRPDSISSDGATGFATVMLDARASGVSTATIEQLVKTAESARSAALQVELGGQAVGQTEQGSVGLSVLVGLGAAIVVLLLSFGSFLAMGLPILTSLFGLGAGIGIVGLGSRLMSVPDFSSQLALMIGLGVGIDYALFILTRYRDAYRENGGDVATAIELAMNTAGRAVIFAGATVVIALMGMFALGVSFLYGLAVAASLAVLLVLAGSITLLPALIGAFGHRIGRAGSGRRAPTTRRRVDRSWWERWIATIQRRPWWAAIIAGALMLTLAAPAFALRLGNADAGNDPTSTTTRRAYDLLASGFGKGFSGPLLIVVEASRPDLRASLTQLTERLRRTQGVASVAGARLSRSHDVATISVFPASSPQSAQTVGLVERIRNDVIPSIARAPGTTILVGGATATQIDFAATLAAKLWLFVGVVIGLSALLMMVVFRSLLIPLQAAAMNLLSIGASMGVVVAVFQWGWLGGLFKIQAGPIEAFLPVMVFAIVFGLSMDYEMFLVSRIHEEWLQRDDSSAAIRAGLVSTGRVITAAAAIMVIVFGSFMLGGSHVIELFGLGLASAVFLDAVVIRSVLLPAVLELMGRATWRFPGWLDRCLPRLAIKPDTRAAVAKPQILR